MTTPHNRNVDGFTLIELLVVVTIIVVLLALLVPALDKALYQAKLVQCAAQQDSSVSSVTLYAFDFNRRYPYKEGNSSPGTFWGLRGIYSPGTNIFVGTGAAAHMKPGTEAGGGFDIRPVIEDYVNYRRLYLDPLAGFVDLDKSASDPDCSVSSTYNHMDGFGMFRPSSDMAKFASAGKGMYKIGDFISYRQRLSNGATIQRRINVLTSDVITYDTLWAGGLMVASHNDHAARGQLSERQNALGGSYPAGAETTYGTGYASPKMTYAHYNIFNASTVLASELVTDINSGMADGSVVRLSNLERVPALQYDDRHPLKPMPLVNSGTDANGEVPDYMPHATWVMTE